MDAKYSMLFKTWLEALSPEQKQLADRYGYELVDETKAGGFNVYLLFNQVYPKGMKYHIGLEREGANVFNLGQQFDKPKEKGDVAKQYSSIQPILEKINEWIESHGDLIIASTNERNG